MTAHNTWILRYTGAACALIIVLAGSAARTAGFDPALFAGLRWRLIGPFRGGRVTAVAGVPGQPNIYYFGTPGGGLWKTSDAGQVWKPIFDSQPVAGIGAIAVAPSNPSVLYMGTGENAAGNGVYKSSDSGATWSHAGLGDTRYIQAVIVDPADPNIAIAGANSLGHQILWRPVPQSTFTTNRGIFKTTDGGKSWNKVLTRDDTIGVVDLCADPTDPRTLYAALYRPATGHGASEIEATSELFKSSDEGSTWRPLTAKGLPETGRGRVGIAVAPGHSGRRLYAILKQGFYRTDDGGATWVQSTKDPRILGSEYFSRVFVDTRNPDVLYVAQTSLYRSTDGGRSFDPFVGAPSGDDFHVLWIDPRNPARMLLGVDQGAILTVNGGQSWSSWYNQPTGEFYHVSTDHVFPYHLYAAQQDSGTAAIASRSDYGEITDRDWISIGGFEYCYIAPDPLNSNLIYSGGWYGTVVRFDKTNAQLATVFERGDKYRTANMAPLQFAPLDPHTLYLGTQFLLKTTDAARTWTEISPDLTGYVDTNPDAKPDPDQPPAPAITALAVSALDPGVLWAGTSNRIVQLTRNGGASWENVSPPGLAEPYRILSIEASRYAAASAYIVAGAARNSTPPYIALTRDYGRTWQKIVDGLPPGEMARVVRADPVRQGLLYAGTDTGVFISFDDGAYWQALRLNLPVVNVTDLAVQGNDLVASTFGRALWILDDVTPLRELSAQTADSPVYLFPPATALRVRWDNYQDTPLLPETPAGQNPPDGAILDYHLKSTADEITLTIYNRQGDKVREFSSRANAPDLPLPNVPRYWFGPPDALSKTTGMNRFVWDLRYPAPQTLPFSYYGNLLEYTEYTLADHAIPGNTPRQQPQGPLVLPGEYQVELRAAGQTLRRNLTVALDPRLHVAKADLEDQLLLEQRIGRGMAASFRAYHEVAAVRSALTARKKQQNSLSESITALEKAIDAVDTGTKTAPGLGPINRDLSRLATSVESADASPAVTARAAVEEKCAALGVTLTRWQELNKHELIQFNTKLSELKLAPLPVLKVDARAGCGP